MIHYIQTLTILTTLMIANSCDTLNQESRSLRQFHRYYTAIKEDSDNRWRFTADTVKLWFDDKDGQPTLQFKGKKSTGKWKEWDKAMNSSSKYDSIWFDTNENAVKGYFFENNDFYKLIGKSPTKTLRTYWLDENNKIQEILMYWIPEENTTTGEHLKPIIEWALKNDSVEIQQLYPNSRIVPSAENAIRWKRLLRKYHESMNAN